MKIWVAALFLMAGMFSPYCCCVAAQAADEMAHSSSCCGDPLPVEPGPCPSQDCALEKCGTEEGVVPVAVFVRGHSYPNYQPFVLAEVPAIIRDVSSLQAKLGLGPASACVAMRHFYCTYQL